MNTYKVVSGGFFKVSGDPGGTYIAPSNSDYLTVDEIVYAFTYNAGNLIITGVMKNNAEEFARTAKMSILRAIQKEMTLSGSNRGFSTKIVRLVSACTTALEPYEKPLSEFVELADKIGLLAKDLQSIISSVEVYRN